MQFAVMMGLTQVKLLKGGNKLFEIFIAAKIGFFDERLFLSAISHDERFFF